MIDSLFSNTLGRPGISEDWVDNPSVFLHNPVATIVFDEATWRILAANIAACTLYGYMSSEFTGMSLLELVSKPTAIPFGPTDFELKAMFLSRLEAWAHKRKDGREILVETISHGFKFEGRHAYIVFVVDKTETLLTQQRLVHALSEAEGALQTKTNFLSTVSHELRTPMSGVIGITTMLAETELSHEQRELVNTVRSSGELLLALIDDILDFMRAEQNELTLQMRDFDLPDIVEEVVEVVKMIAHQKRIRLNTFIAPDVPRALLGDSGRLKQILLNLLTNGVKFADRGTVSVSIRLAEGRADPVKLLFEVQDTGIGISAAEKERLFEGFSQADSSSTRKFGGTGLGLAISKRLAALMDGEIGVTSEPGEGSTFWFTARFELNSKPAQTGPKPDAFRGEEVLVVQENAEERRTTCLLLEEMGMLVTEAANAPQAISLCSGRAAGSSGFAFCLVDSNLPVIDSMEFARILRARAFGEKTRIVMMVAHRTAEQAAQGGEIGINGFVVKPLRKKQLATAFSRANSAPATTPQGRSGGPAAILLVEDNVVNQRVASHSLLKLGYAVEIASNGLQAVDAFERRGFDLILMDCHMPVMDGYAATEKIRSSSISGRYVPIIAMTADVLETQRQRCIAAGMNDFLSKPVKREILSDMLQHWLAQA